MLGYNLHLAIWQVSKSPMPNIRLYETNYLIISINVRIKQSLDSIQVESMWSFVS